MPRETLIYDGNTKLVLCGPFQGQDAVQIRHQFERIGYTYSPLHVRPWWRLWRLTPAWLLELT